jgi:hypothetical protein
MWNVFAERQADRDNARNFQAFGISFKEGTGRPNGHGPPAYKPEELVVQERAQQARWPMNQHNHDVYPQYRPMPCQPGGFLGRPSDGFFAAVDHDSRPGQPSRPLDGSSAAVDHSSRPGQPSRPTPENRKLIADWNSEDIKTWMEDVGCGPIVPLVWKECAIKSVSQLQLLTPGVLQNIIGSTPTLGISFAAQTMSLLIDQDKLPK